MITITTQPAGLNINGIFYPKNKVIAQYSQNKVRFIYEHKILTDFNAITDVTIDGTSYATQEELMHDLGMVM